MNQLLFVCRANVLRSAAAEALARSLAPGGDWRFASAGVQTMAGNPIDIDVASALATRGVSAADHRARQLSAPLLREADLILTFEVSQRAWVIREDPRRARSVLTIRRAAAILGEGAGTAGEPAPLSACGLGLLRADSHRYGPDGDFADPIGQSPQAISAAVDEIEVLLKVILRGIGAETAQWETRQWETGQ